MTVEPARANGRTRRVSAPPLQAVPPEATADFLLGALTSQVAAVASDVGTLKDAVEDLKETAVRKADIAELKRWMGVEQLASAQQQGAANARQSGMRWVAPNLYQLLQLLVLLGVAYIAISGR